MYMYINIHKLLIIQIVLNVCHIIKFLTGGGCIFLWQHAIIHISSTRSTRFNVKVWSSNRNSFNRPITRSI